MNKRPVETIMGIVVIAVAAFLPILPTMYRICRWLKDTTLRLSF